MSVAAGGQACYSTLPSYKLTTGCALEWPTADLGTISISYLLYGNAVHGDLLTVTDTKPINKTISTVFTSDDVSSYIGVSTAPVLTLVHQPSDTQSSGTGPTSSSTAVVARLGPGTWGDVSALLAICGVTIAIGMVLILPW